MSGDHHKSGKETLIAVLSDEGIASFIGGYCEEASIEHANIQVREEPLTDAPTIVNGGAAIVVIQAGLGDENTMLRLEKLCRYISNGGAIIVILEDPDTTSMRRLFRAGVTDVLPTPVSEVELRSALDAARSKHAATIVKPEGKGKIICVMKTAGGVGATTVTINLARELIDLTQSNVAIVDLDIQFGKVGLALDLQSRMDVTDAIRAGERLDGTLLRSIMTKHKSGIDVLPAPDGVTPLDVITEKFIGSLFRELRLAYDYVIVELPPAWSHWFGPVLEGADIIAPVVETSVRSADGAKRLIRGLNDLSITDPNLFVIANGVVKRPESKDRLRQFGNILGSAPEAVIRFDDKLVNECADIGRCLKDASASAPITQDFSALARKITNRFGVKTDGVSASAPKKGLFAGKLPILGDR